MVKNLFAQPAYYEELYNIKQNTSQTDNHITMKTISDLNALIPQLVALSVKSPEIGECFRGRDDYEENMAENFVCYDEDGWCIEISYLCCGEWDEDRGDYFTPPSCKLRRTWGEVTDITAIHYDEKTEEEIKFSGEDLKEIRTAIEKALEHL